MNMKEFWKNVKKEFRDSFRNGIYIIVGVIIGAYMVEGHLNGALTGSQWVNIIIACLILMFVTAVVFVFYDYFTK